MVGRDTRREVIKDFIWEVNSGRDGLILVLIRSLLDIITLLPASPSFSALLTISMASASAAASSGSRSRHQTRKKPNDDAAYMAPPSATAGTKRQATDKADGEPRVKRKRVDPITATASGTGKKDGEEQRRSSMVSHSPRIPGPEPTLGTPGRIFQNASLIPPFLHDPIRYCSRCVAVTPHRGRPTTAHQPFPSPSTLATSPQSTRTHHARQQTTSRIKGTKQTPELSFARGRKQKPHSYFGRCRRGPNRLGLHRRKTFQGDASYQREGRGGYSCIIHVRH